MALFLILKLQETINTNGVDKLIYEILILKNRNE